MQNCSNSTNVYSMTKHIVRFSMAIFISICFTIYCAIQEDTHSKQCDVQNLRSKQTRGENDS